MKAHLLLPVFWLVLCGGQAFAQRYKGPPAPPKIEDLPCIPIDTIPTHDPETQVIVYSNNTWSYYRPALNRYDELPVYTQNWDTSHVFAYRNIELSDLPEKINLRLIDSLGQFKCPVRGDVSSKYGRRRNKNHNGVDIPLKRGEPVYATFDGKVRYARYNTGGYGYLVILRHANGLETWHGHLSKLNVRVNDYVKQGQVIGFGGNTGRSRGNHLHYEVRYCDQTFDPEFLIDFPTGRLKDLDFALHRSYFNIRSRASEILEDIDDEETLLPGSLLAQADDSTAVRAAMPPRSQDREHVYHTIVRGDMLSKLALKYKVSVDQICRLNNIKRTTILQLGRRLLIQ